MASGKPAGGDGTGEGGKPRPSRDRKHGAGMLIRPHAGAETRVKSGKRAEAPTVPKKR
jgi:hypothetical protein